MLFLVSGKWTQRSSRNNQQQHDVLVYSLLKVNNDSGFFIQNESFSGHVIVTVLSSSFKFNDNGEWHMI